MPQLLPLIAPDCASSTSETTPGKPKKSQIRLPGPWWSNRAFPRIYAVFNPRSQLPYGIYYDVRRNAGLVTIGTSHETAAFAVDTLEYWWRHEGKKYYPGAQELLILADGGGANSSRSTVWKCDLQQKLCNRHGLKVTVCHYPPGASKWNPIEHRLFSEISKHWQGVPLDSYDTILNYIRRTKTKTGLSVTATLNTKTYPKGEKATPEELALLNIRGLHPHPEWNYIIKPQTRKQLRRL